jgi:hypothetical protein
VDGEQLMQLVLQEIDHYNYQPPADLAGDRWPREKVEQHLERMWRALVRPYRQRFELRETSQQVSQPSPEYAEYWVVADTTGGNLEWFDPVTGEFGLGQHVDSGLPVSIGVRGDAVGVFMAM